MSRGPTIVAAIAAALTLGIAAPLDASAAPAAPQSECLRAIFYSPADWLRLAQKLAAHNVPCAQYYVGVPPLAAEKTTFRPDQPWRIRALGPNFHAVAEISYNGWARWIADNGKTWYDAGVEARTRMATQGYDIAAGDTWAINESSSAVRTGAGQARQNLRDLARGLYTGAPGAAPTKGIVFVVGVGQSSTSLPTYKGTLQLWFDDDAFWNDMSNYVSDWSQEVYGDVMKYAVAGSSPDVRRDELNAWLQHPLSLVNAAPDEAATARSFLQATYSPLANAAWRYGAGSGFGWTDVPTEVMQDYVSAQVYAMRSAGARLGFAWTPKRPEGVSSTQFAAQSGALLDRLAKAIHDSVSAPDAACAATCAVSLTGASFNEGWRDFATWSPAELDIVSPSVTAVTGTTAGPLTVRLKLAGIARPDTQVVPVTLTSSSVQGSFAPTADGPWTSTLTVEVPVGSTDATFYYRDATAGSPSIGVSAPGRVGDEQVETIVAAAKPAAVPKTPAVRVTKVAYTAKRGKLRVAVTTVDPRRQRVARADVRLALRRNGHWFAAVSVRTGTRGVGTFTRPTKAGCYSVNVVRVEAKGFAWDKVTPKNGFCVPTPVRARSA
jgi:hypothetical protein